MKNFVFDLYNTLIDIETDEHCERAWADVISYFGELGIRADHDSLCREYDGYWARFNAKTASVYAYPECDCVAQFQEIATRLGGKLTREQATHALRLMRKASRNKFRLFEGTTELLDELHACGAHVYLLSNAQSAFTPGEMEEVGLKDKFDGILLSSDCGCRKPDTAFFGMLFDKYGFDRSDTVMIGDDVTSDGAGAADFGIPFIHVPGGAAAHKDRIMEAVSYE